jgi:hypothetical protein
METTTRKDYTTKAGKHINTTFSSPAIKLKQSLATIMTQLFFLDALYEKRIVILLSIANRPRHTPLTLLREAGKQIKNGVLISYYKTKIYL